MSPQNLPEDDLVIPELQRAFLTGLATPVAGPRRISPRRPLVLGLGFVLTAAVVAVILSVALAASPSTGPVNVMARAQAALPAEDELVHYAVRVQSVRRIPTRGATRFEAPSRCVAPPTEVWQTKNANRWRALTPSNSICRSDGTPVSVPETDGVEFAWNHGTSSWYTRGRSTMQIVSGYPLNSSAGVVPVAITSVGTGDPITVVRKLLAEGDLRSLGDRTLGGRKVRRLLGTRTMTRHDIFTSERYTYDVDPSTFEPVRITRVSRSRPADTTNRCGRRCRAIKVPQTITLDFENYERQPLNSDTQKLLTINPPKGTRITRQTQTELRQKIARGD